MASLSKQEIERYSRHLIMPEVGIEGQEKLKAASVLIVGAGGLGSPLAMYLAAAGVGRIGIVDFDTVDVTNLHRQLVHGTSDIGRSKLDSAKETIANINPHVQVDTYETMLSSESAMDILSTYDIIADGTDNFPARYLVNDACVLLGKPNVYGSIFRFEGQASVFWAERGPCYRCLYPQPPSAGLVPSCAQGGVLGILPGIIGIVQATEVIKLIIAKGEPMLGRLLLFDALAMKFREVKLQKNPTCPVCSEEPVIKELVDYKQVCAAAGKTSQDELSPEFQLNSVELNELLEEENNIFLLDVREVREYDVCKLDNSYLIPLGELEKRIEELDSKADIVVYCRSGRRSAEAVQFLREQGFKRVRNLEGGILGWARDIDSTLPRY